MLRFTLSNDGSSDLQRTAELDKSKEKGEAKQGTADQVVEGRACTGEVAMQWTENPMLYPFPEASISSDTNGCRLMPHGSLQGIPIRNDS